MVKETLYKTLNFAGLCVRTDGYGEIFLEFMFIFIFYLYNYIYFYNLYLFIYF